MVIVGKVTTVLVCAQSERVWVRVAVPEVGIRVE